MSPPPSASPDSQPPPLPPSSMLESIPGNGLGVARRAVGRRLALVGCAAVLVSMVLGVVYLISAHRRLAACRALAKRYGAEAGLDPALVLTVIQAESGGRPRAVSRAGARGLMQLMPATAEDVATRHGIRLSGPDDLFDPALNVRLGTLYLASLKRFFADDPRLYLAAYNAGMGNVDKWRLQNPELTSRELIDQVAFPETRAYVARVLAIWGKGD